MRTRPKRFTVLLAVITSAGTLLACGGDQSSPTDEACDRLVEVGKRMQREGSLPTSEYREAFAAAWREAAQDSDSPIADPLDRSIGIIDRSTTGYLLPADGQHLATQLDQIEQICTSR